MSMKEIWHQPLPHQSEKWGTRLLVRAMTLLARRFVVSIHGSVELLQEDKDPFVVVFNHNQRLESVLIPSLLFFYRGGKPIHFLADWNFLMMPVVASLYRRSQTIIVTNKSARPRFLNVLKPLFKEETPAFDRALACLNRGASLGIFPEGTMNRDPDRMMRGSTGAARLAIRAGVPVIPVGVRFPELLQGQPITDGARMSLHLGSPIHAEISGDRHRDVNLFHAQIMTQLADLCGKHWHVNANKRRKYVS